MRRDETVGLRLLLWATLLLGIILAVANLLVLAWSVLLLIFLGLLFGVFLFGISSWMSRTTRLSYSWSYLLLLLLLALLAGAGIYFLGTNIVQQVSELSDQLQAAAQNVPKRLEEYRWAKKYLPQQEEWKEVLKLDRMMSRLAQTVQAFGWAVTVVFVIVFIGIYVAAVPDSYKAKIVKLTPPARRARVEEVLQELYATLTSWIVGRLISMCLIGALTAAGLWLLNVPLPITLGVLAALLTFIPNIGPVLAAIPQALLALEIGVNTALYVILFNIVLQTIESYLITPMVQQYKVSLPPALTISAQLLMGVLVGLIGVVTAAPLMAAAIVVVEMLYVQDYLGDPNPGPPVTES